MAYLLNNIDLSTYGFIAGHATGSNISLQGCFDLPARTGKTFHDWGDEHGIEPYVASGEIFFAGRDLILYGSILGTNAAINTYLDAFYTAIKAFTGLVTLSTPYGDFSVQVKSVNPEYLHGGASVSITFREPVVDLTGGTLPATGSNAYTIDDIPMVSFGLYLSKADALNDLPELKEQYFTKYGSEGYQISKRKHNTLDINGFIIASSLADFQSKVKALYLSFSSTGTRTIVLNYEKSVVCFASEGFKIDGVYLFDGMVIANLRMSLLVETQEATVIQDVDGNEYTYVTIGTQQWLVENFRCTKYADGTPIPNLTLAADWIAEDGTTGHDGAYCAYDNDPANITDYGLLYNWHAVNNAHGLAMTGWKIPSKTDWETLTTFIGGLAIGGGKLKEVGITHWNTPNQGATDEYGFKALPGGRRLGLNGNFVDIKTYNALWSETSYNALNSWYVDMGANVATIDLDYYVKKDGYNIRMMRDI